jgi:hypothetical protein
MNQQQQDLMIDLVSHRISKDRFLASLFNGGEIPKDYLRAQLETALEIKDADSVECLLIFGAVFGFTQDCADVLCRLLIEDWHISHENIARELKVFKYPEAVGYLFKAALTCYPYIASEHALGVKCIYALHEIGTNKATEKIRLLSQVDNAEMSELATRLLARV